MKRLLNLSFVVIIILLIGISSCSKPSERDLVVMEYEQNIGEGVKIDLNMKIISSQDMGLITGQDSLEYFHQKYKYIGNKGDENKILTLDEMVDILERVIKDFSELVVEYQYKLDSVKGTRGEFMIPTYNHSLLTVEQSVIENQIKKEELLRYYDRKDEVLAKKVQYVYKINNPMLNGVEQEITKTYIFNIEENQIIETL